MASTSGTAKDQPVHGRATQRRESTSTSTAAAEGGAVASQPPRRLSPGPAPPARHYGVRRVGHGAPAPAPPPPRHPVVLRPPLQPRAAAPLLSPAATAAPASAAAATAPPCRLFESPEREEAAATAGAPPAPDRAPPLQRSTGRGRRRSTKVIGIRNR